MSNPFVPRLGGVLSADIAVPDHETVQRFYANVLGTGDSPRWREDLMNNLGMPIIGVGKRVKEYEQLPLQWMPHMQVADVATSVRRAVDLGGRELMHGKADDGTSQWAVLRDPSGAAFGVIPVPPAPPPPDGDQDPEKAGRIAWLDLTVRDATSTRDFYREVIGWSVQDVPLKDGDESYADYCMLAPDGEACAGVCHARGVNEGLPQVWLVYLPVGDLTESLRRAEAGGGEVIKASKGDGGAYTYAVIRDPVGGYVALVPAS